VRTLEQIVCVFCHGSGSLLLIALVPTCSLVQYYDHLAILFFYSLPFARMVSEYRRSDLRHGYSSKPQQLLEFR
jgi:hypothetical protein